MVQGCVKADIEAEELVCRGRRGSQTRSQETTQPQKHTRVHTWKQSVHVPALERQSSLLAEAGGSVKGKGLVNVLYLSGLQVSSLFFSFFLFKLWHVESLVVTCGV